MLSPLRQTLGCGALVAAMTAACSGEKAPDARAVPSTSSAARPTATAGEPRVARQTDVAEPLRGIGSHLRSDISSVTFDPSRTGCADDVGPSPDWKRVPIAPASDECIHAAFDNASAIAAEQFKPKIAAAAHACFLANGLQGNCLPSKVSPCNHAALMSACLDPSADATCDAIDKLCPRVERATCLSYASGLNAEGRRHLVDCLSDACGRGFLSCTTLL